ncbi:isopeptide-forming domain-containing fimbrial protein [Rhodococcus erythropolis]|uniref:isopeptide-forming domain-containing fimbrial protein n=8 Tax=Rhodococcus erythropolis TaxID=1833 RepID=UPI00211E17AE|nr:isopeptide-forming domain-containing fimbrial protein [Rhodococcus erythropolis]
MPNDIPPTRSALFTAGLPPWVRAWTVVWTAIAMILGLSGATAVAASAQPAATLGGPVQAQTPARAAVLPDEQPPTGCAFSAPNTGNLSQNICWIDMSTFNQAAATSAAGQPMTVKLTDIYSISFNAKLVNSIDGSTTKPHTGVTARPLPAEAKFSSLGTVAYTGVPNTVKPALYQTVPDMNGSTRVQSGGTVKLDNIVMNGPNGAVNNYGLVVADAESTDPVAANNKEFLSFQSDKSFRQIDRTMGIPGTAGWPPIRACNGTVGGADGLTGLGTNSVRCDSWWDNDFSKNYSPGAVVLAATAPTSFAGTFGNTTDSTSRQGVAFGILLPRVKIDKELTRVSPGDDFTIGTSTGTFADANAASGQVLKTTDTGATDTTASTGWRMLLADTTPTPVTFWEKPTTSATKTANYATKWDCQVNGVAKNLQAGGVAQTALAPGDNAYCKIINTPVLVKKSSSPPTGETVNIGQTITYTLNFENPGTAPATIDYTDFLADVIDDGTVAVGAATGGLTAALNGTDKIKVGGTLPAGGKGTVTYTVTVKDGGNKVLNNYLVPGTTTPPTTCDPATNLCTTHPMPGFTVAKTAVPATGSTVQAGDTITYTVTGANTGKTALTPATIKDDLSAVLNNAAVVPGSLKATVDGAAVAAPTLSGSILSWSANLQAGKSVVLTYQVKVNAGVAAGTVLNNKVTGTAKPPTGPDITPPTVETNHSVPGFKLEKTADPISGSTVQAGESIKYTVTGTNTGKTKLDPVKINDDLGAVLNNAAVVPGSLKATVDGAPAADPTLSGTTLSWTGFLEAGKSVVLTYEVKVNDGVAAGTVLNNEVTGTAKPPTGPEITPPSVETNHLVPGFTVAKTADPVSGTNVAAGQTITYTVTGANTGNTTLDPVVLTDDLSKVLDNAALVDGSLKATVDGAPATVPTLSGTTLSWTGALEAGKSVVLTYQVKINDGVAGGVLVNNKVTGTAKPPTGPEITPPPVTTEHPVVSPKIAVVKSSDPVSGSNVVAGQDIKYTLTFSNTGNGAGEVAYFDDLRQVVDKGALSGLTADAPLAATMVGTDGFSVTGTLAAGETKTVTYSVKVNADVVGGVFVNNFVVPGTTPPVDPPEVCDPATQLCTTHPVVSPKIAVVKSSDPVSGSNVVAGQDIKYTLTFSNTGNGAGEVAYFDDLRQVVDKGALSGLTADAPLAATMVGTDGFSVTGTLAAGETKTVTYSVKVNADVVGGVFVNNFVVPGTTPPVDPPEVCDPATQLCTTHPVVSPKIAVVKSSDPVSGSNVVAGQDIKYTLTFSNTGNGAGEVAYFDDLRQVVDKGALSGLTADAPLAATMVGTDGFSVTGTLAAGETKTVTYSVKVNADVVGGVFVNNFVVPGTTPPVDPPEVCDPATQLCTTHPVVSPKIAVVKSSDPVSGSNVVAGQDIKYTLTFSNTGNGAGEVAYFDDLRQVVDKGALSGLTADAPLAATMVGTDGFSVTGTLAAGETKTVTYSVKVNADVVGGVFVNNFVVPGTTPPVDPPEVCDPATQLCTTHPVVSPKIAVVKSSDPVSGSNVVAGQDIKYTLTFSNTGNGAGEVAYFDDLRQVVDKGALSGLTADAPLAATMVGSDGFSVTGTLAAGETKTVTYSVKVNADVVGGVFVNNFVVPGTTPPVDPPEVCDPATQLCTTHPVQVPGFTVAKTADPVSGTNVAAGQTITYTVTGANTGNTTLDPVVLTDDLSKVLDNAALVDGSLKATVDGVDATAPTLEGTTLSWTGALEAGKSVVLTYQVKINDGVAGGVLINNKVTGTAKPPTGPEITPPPVTTEHPVKVPGFTVAKTADPVSGTNVAAGQTITYTVTGANTGNTTLDPVVLTDDLSKVLDNAALVDGSLKATVDGVDATAPTLEGTTLSWTGALEAGKSVVLTYQVKINDGVAGGVLINNKVTGTAKPPTGPEITPPPVTTEHPVKVPGFTVAKTADPVSGTNVAAGQTITYTVTGANTGNTTLDPVVLTDDLSKVLDNAALVDGSLKATVDGVDATAPTLEGTTLSWTGALEAGKSVVLTYQVKINDGVAGGVLINNKVTGTAKPPTGPEITPPPVTTEHPVDGTPAIEVLKSSDPSTTNRVVGGQEITYTLTFKNVGTADGEISFYDDLTDVLDDAVMTKNPATTSTLVVSGVVDNVFTVTGKLAKGESATVTYTVKVNPEIGTLSGPGFTPGVLNNYLVVGGENPPVDCVPGDALCTEHPVDPPETTTTVPPTTTTTPPVTTEPCVPPTTTTTRMVPTTTVATTTASATTAGDADVTGTEESTTREETTTEETTTEEIVAEEIVDPCGVTTTTPPTTTTPVTTVPPTTTVPNTTVPVTPTIIIPPIVVVPPIVVPPTVPGQPVPSTVPGQPKPPTANPGQPGQPKPPTSAPQGGTINSGGGAGESGVNTGLLAAGGLVLLLALGTGVVLLTRKRREDGDN